MIKSIFLGLSFTLLAGAGCSNKKNAIDEGLTKMEGLSKQVCACKDMECAQKVKVEMVKALVALAADEGANATKAQDAKMDKIMSDMEACMDKLAAAPADRPAPITP